MSDQKINESIDSSISIGIADSHIGADLNLPVQAKGLIIFAHGSGSSRYSVRNKFVARKLRNANYATLLIDLLTPEEEREDLVTMVHRFNVELLAERLVATCDWCDHYKELRNLDKAYFGASTGSAAALIAASRQEPGTIKAIVSRGGRPDMAQAFLKNVTAPTLFLVGELDTVVIDLNQTAYQKLAAEKEIKIISGATHLFEEEGKLGEVTKEAKAWFDKYLCQNQC